jgi:hypothetical protein
MKYGAMVKKDGLIQHNRQHQPGDFVGDEGRE